MRDTGFNSYSEKEKDKVMSLIGTFLDRASFFPAELLTEVMSYLYYELAQRIENEDDADKVSADLSMQLTSRLGGKEKVFFKEKELLAKLFETASGQVIKEAMSQGMEFSEVMESITDPEALERLSTLLKI